MDRSARRNLSASLEGELKKRSIETKVVGPDIASEELNKYVLALYKAVSGAILAHTYGSIALNWNFFPKS